MVGGPPIFMPQQMHPGMAPQAAPRMPPQQGIPHHMQAGGYVPPRLTPPAKAQPAPAPAPRVARGARPAEPARQPVAPPLAGLTRR
jgi:hypothetical protein